MLGLAAGLVMSLGLVAPTLAADNGDVTVTGSNQATLNLTIDDASLDFGTVDPNGTGTSAALIDTSGAAYTTSNIYTVRSNVAYDSTVSVVEAAGGANDISVANGSLDWSTSPMTTFGEATGGTTFIVGPNSGSAGVSGDKFPSAAGDPTTIYYGLRVLWTDDPSDLDATLTYTVAQA
jgi:hypothetical protein